MKELNIKQKKFADYFVQTGNATESYHRAGYKAEGNSAEVNASRLLRNAKVIDFIEERNKELDTKFIADIEETKRFWTEILRDPEIDIKDRLKASEYIVKTNGAFLDKKELSGKWDNKVTFSFVDPASDSD